VENPKAGIQISKKSFFSSVIILFFLMIVAGILTKIIPAGVYERIIVDGREVIDVSTFTFVSDINYPIYRWFTAPIEVLWSPDALTVIVIIFFILFIGATFAILDKSGILKYIMNSIVKRFEHNKYILLAVLTLSFMLFGSVFGIFEELVALVPISITLAYSLGWDSLVGLGMSALASGFGFAAATFNPFTIGVAQKLSGLPPFSGILYRILIFGIIYFILTVFLTRYAKKIEKNPELSSVYEDDKLQREKYKTIENKEEVYNPNLEKAVKVFLGFLIIIVLLIVSGFFIKGISDISLPLVAILFLIGGLVAGKISKYTEKGLIKDLVQGLTGIAPSVLLILMAMSVKLIITNGGSMDTILYYASSKIANLSPYTAGIFIYLLILFLNFFIGSGSAKAFLIIPIITPLTDLVGITRQVAVQAFCFGDGFSNMLYPTNAVLMIALGLTVVSYPKWFKWTIKLQLMVFFITTGLLFAAISFGYGPF
jgi:uncharacterized ion transporter superfamily protein YfcC